MTSTFSLSGRIACWVAFLTVAGMASLSTAVYILTASSIESRQTETLSRYQLLVTHLVSEVKSAQDFAIVQHKLDDFLLGHEDLSVVLRNSAAVVVYQKRDMTRNLSMANSKTVSFGPLAPPGFDGDLTGMITLGTMADDALLQKLSSTLWIASLLAALIVSISGWIIVSLGTKPLTALVRQTAALSAKTYGRRLVAKEQPKELQPLIAQFNALLDRLENAYSQMEGFNADVAHELNTPLSNLIVGTQLALSQDNQDCSKLEETLASNLEELQRLAGIVRDMLFLSNADRGVKARRQPVASLASICQATLDYHEASFHQNGLSAKLTGDASGNFDADLVKRALSNLLSNASRYAYTASTITVSVSSETDAVVVSVTNSGPGIGPDHLPRLFDRFFRVEQSRQLAAENHGLGLAIVSAVARMHNGLAFARSTDGTTTIGFSMGTQT